VEWPLLHEPAAEALVKHIADLVRRGPRRLVLAVLVLGAAVISGACETSSTITTTPDPVKCQVSLGTTPMVEAVGGTGTLAVTTQPECAWEASTSASWISGLSPASGQGTANLAFRVAPNEGTASREGTIVVNGQQARVSQRAVCRYELAPPSQTIATSGGTSSVTITTSSDCPWTATTGASWITLTPPFTGSGSATLGFTVVGNPGSGRTASIVVAGQQATVIQSAADTTPPCNAGHIALSPTSQNVGAAGGTGSTTVSTNTVCLWSAVSNVPWITITSDANGIGNGSVAFAVAANLGASRTGTLTIAGQAFTVTQAAVVGGFVR
jgi:Putative binding domain, N-terminal/Viral BACON domain